MTPVPDIRIASSTAELAAVYPFRYAIYVEEMGYTESSADHAERLLFDSLDPSAALVLAAWEKGRVIGTVRLNRFSGAGTEAYLHYYCLTELDAEALQATSLCTRLMVDRAFRCTPLAVRLCCETYRWGLENGVKTGYCDCAPANVTLFRRMGYHIEVNDFEHPDFGLGAVMRLDLFDSEHLAAVRSPFRKFLSTYQNDRVLDAAEKEAEPCRT
jgi:N-acyl-L-homoserine lactone synthetase